MPYPYGGGGRPWMPSYEGGAAGPPQGYYPSQHSMLPKEPPQRGRSTRGGHGSTLYPMSHMDQRPQLHQRSHPADKMGNAEDENSKDNAPNSSISPTGEAPHSPQRHSAEELDRMKAAAAAELGLAEVKPIQTDFHFFVLDRRAELLELATSEVDKSLEGKNEELIKKHRKFLINSNLNCRLSKAWEDLPRDLREEYFKKEEDDRQRFMEDDEVVSRHCFTLTARIRSPSKNNKSPHVAPDDDDNLLLEHEDIDDDDKPGKRSPVDAENESLSKRNKSEGDVKLEDFDVPENEGAGDHISL